MKIVIVSMDNLSNTRKILIMILLVYFQERHEYFNEFAYKDYGFFIYRNVKQSNTLFLSINFRYFNTIINLRKHIVKYKMSN